MLDTRFQRGIALLTRGCRQCSQDAAENTTLDFVPSAAYGPFPGCQRYMGLGPRVTLGGFCTGQV